MQCPRCGQPLTGDPPECSWCAGALAETMQYGNLPPGNAYPNGNWRSQANDLFANLTNPGAYNGLYLSPMDDAWECGRIATIFALLTCIAPPVFGTLALFYGFRTGMLGAWNRAILPLAIVALSVIVLVCLFLKVR